MRHRSTLFVQVCTHKCHNFVYLWLGEPRNLAATTFRRCIYLLFVQREVTGTTGVAGSGSKAVIYRGPTATPCQDSEQFRKPPINMRNDMKRNVSFWSCEKLASFSFTRQPYLLVSLRCTRRYFFPLVSIFLGLTPTQKTARGINAP